jgi:sugar phosphate permease
MKINNENLRALAGIILLVLCVLSMWKTNSSQVFDYVILSLVGFLAGGSLLSNQKKEEE